MSLHLQREIESLKRSTLTLCSVVEENVRRAVVSVEKRDASLAQMTIDTDAKIDKMEIEVEEECLKVLALYQPVAVDLRFLIAVLKLNNDLERIGDLAVNIAERTLYLVKQPPAEFSSNLPVMADKVRLMLKNCLDALVNLNARQALEVCIADDEVDALYGEMFQRVVSETSAHPDKLDYLLQFLSVSRHLERIGDHATNIAEDVIYMVEGKIIRHKGGAPKS